MLTNCGILLWSHNQWWNPKIEYPRGEVNWILKFSYKNAKLTKKKLHQCTKSKWCMQDVSKCLTK